MIALKAAPINQYDLLMIAGGYGYRPRCLPSWARKESAARRAISQWFGNSVLPDTGRLNTRAPEPCASKILEVL
jgi:hypothetical protein